MVSGIQDTSNGGRYHNKRFKAEAGKRDLKIEYAKYIGFSATSPTQRFIEVIREHDLYSQIGHCRTTFSSELPPPYPTGVDGTGVSGAVAGKKKTSTRKYICNSCGISVRATKEVNLICEDCMDTLVKVD